MPEYDKCLDTTFLEQNLYSSSMNPPLEANNLKIYKTIFNQLLTLYFVYFNIFQFKTVF